MAAVHRMARDVYPVGNAMAQAACAVPRLAARGTLPPIPDDEQDAGPARRCRPYPRGDRCRRARRRYFWMRLIFVPCSPAPAIRPDWPKTKA